MKRRPPMSNDDAHEMRHSVTCPACRSTRGMLQNATTVAGYPEIIRVDLRCAACTHDWTLFTRHSESPIESESER